MFFFFMQKTAYEMRISDWSSDVCSSDLVPVGASSQASCGLRLPPKPPGAPSANSEGIVPLLSKLLLWMRIACLFGSGFGIAQALCDRREHGEGVGQDAGEFAPAPGGEMRRAEDVGRRRRQVDRKSTRLNSSP